MENDSKTPKSFTLKEAAAFLALSEMRVRKAIRAGDLKSHLEPVSADSITQRHIIKFEDIQAWRSNVGTRVGARKDGRTKYNLYATEAEIVRIRKMIATEKLETPLARPAYKKNKKSAAKKAAALVTVAAK